MVHDMRCKCAGCKKLKTTALTEPGIYGRRDDKICTDCAGPTDPPRSARFYPVCRRCAWKRFAALDYRGVAYAHQVNAEDRYSRPTQDEPPAIDRVAATLRKVLPE